MHASTNIIAVNSHKNAPLTRIAEPISLPVRPVRRYTIENSHLE